MVRNKCRTGTNKSYHLAGMILGKGTLGVFMVDLTCGFRSRSARQELLLNNGGALAKCADDAVAFDATREFQ